MVKSKKSYRVHPNIRIYQPLKIFSLVKAGTSTEQVQYKRTELVNLSKDIEKIKIIPKHDIQEGYKIFPMIKSNEVSSFHIPPNTDVTPARNTSSLVLNLTSTKHVQFKNTK